MGGHSLPGAPYSILYCLLMMKPERERERVCIPYEAAGASSFHEPRSSSSTMLRNKGTHLVLAGFFGYWVSSWSGRVARGEGVCLFQRTKHFLVSLLPFHSCIYQKRHEWIMIRIQQFFLCQDTKPSPAKPASPHILTFWWRRTPPPPPPHAIALLQRQSIFKLPQIGEGSSSRIIPEQVIPHN